jgi:hypothetical protein
VKRWILVRPHESGLGPREVWTVDGWQREAKGSNSRRFLYVTFKAAVMTKECLRDSRGVEVVEITVFNLSIPEVVLEKADRANVGGPTIDASASNERK